MALEVIFWDVQHGLANYINTPNNTKFVHDMGIGSYKDNDESFNPLIHLKEEYDINLIDQIIITHPHKDHIEDIVNLEQDWNRLRRPTHLSKEEVLEDVRDEDMDIFEEYFDIGTAYSDSTSSSSSLNSEDPKDPENNGGVDIEIFSPQSCSTSNLDNHSLVTVLSYAGVKIVMPGDNRPPSINELMDKTNFKNSVKDSDILLAPHHGTESAYHSDFVDLVDPRLTIISAGSHDPDTSATENYREKSEGWKVHHRDGRDSEERKCVTTRNDGYIVLKVGYNEDKPFLKVTID